MSQIEDREAFSLFPFNVCGEENEMEGIRWI